MHTQIKAIIGLGNPGHKFEKTRHNIGFQVLDALALNHQASWASKDNLEYTQITFKDEPVYLIKPQTFMNDSGKVIPFLLKKGIKPEEILVVHDELEKPFGSVSIKSGGSARGHNGLRSIISIMGADFPRLRCGIGRPEHKEDVANYVLRPFSESEADLKKMINQAIDLIIK